MSSLWTPGGEVPVGPPRQPPPAPPTDRPGPPREPARARTPPAKDEAPPDEAELEALRQQLARTPAATVIANHAFGLFELAALHLSLSPPQLNEARLAIDALGALIAGLEGRLGEAEPTIKDGLAQLRLAFVQLRPGSEAQTDGGS